MHRVISVFLGLTVVAGTLIVVSSEKWFIIWVGLETRTLALVPLLCSKFSPRKVEASIKYFLIQALRAAILLKGALIQAWLVGTWSVLEPLNNISSILLIIAIAFKLGLSPCHFWFPDVLQGLPFLQGLIIATWQKIAPLIILFSFRQLILVPLIIILGVLSVLIGGWGGLNQTQTRKILAFSSIGKMGWITITSVYSYNAALSMLAIYLIINTAIFLVLDFFKAPTLGHLKILAQLSPIRVLLITLSVLSLGGLPPLTGFMIKFFSLFFLIRKGFILLSSLLIMGRLLSLFFYLRISFNTSLILFPQHMISLTSWRKMSHLVPTGKTWLVSTFSVLGTITIPLTLFLYITI